MEQQTSKLVAAFACGLLIATGTAYIVAHSGPRTEPIKSEPVSIVQAPVIPPASPVDLPAPSIEPKLEPVKLAKVSNITHKSSTKSAAATTSDKATPNLQGGQSASSPTTTANAGQNAKPGNSPFDVPNGAPPYDPSSTSGTSAQTPPPPPPQPHTVTIPAGTAIQVRLNDSLSSEHNNTGDRFRATLTAPIVVNGFVIADRGATAEGQIVQAEQSGRVKGRANMQLALSSVDTTDHQRVNVQTDSFKREAASSTGTDTAKVAGAAAIGALIGGLAGGGKGAAIGAGVGGAGGTGVVLGTRGKPVTIPTETAMTFRLTSPVTVTENLQP